MDQCLILLFKIIISYSLQSVDLKNRLAKRMKAVNTQQKKATIWPHSYSLFTYWMNISRVYQLSDFFSFSYLFCKVIKYERRVWSFYFKFNDNSKTNYIPIINIFCAGESHPENLIVRRRWMYLSATSRPSYLSLLEIKKSVVYNFCTNVYVWNKRLHLCLSCFLLIIIAYIKNTGSKLLLCEGAV